ncbi:uncharacterized protein LOC142603697 [Balearica regulorum gibbericeps]|uniref:uncharacterized protein LOC142603697 n=1 Tax=Balearica regulorum gibbericeps TaxID=100784 RepID=UPI003F5F1ECA
MRVVRTVPHGTRCCRLCQPRCQPCAWPEAAPPRTLPVRSLVCEYQPGSNRFSGLWNPDGGIGVVLPARRARRGLVLGGALRQHPVGAWRSPLGLALVFAAVRRPGKSAIPRKDRAWVWQEELLHRAVSACSVSRSSAEEEEKRGEASPPGLGGDTADSRVSAGAAPWWEGATGLATPGLLSGWVPAVLATILLLRAGTAASSAGDCVGRTALGRAITQPGLNAVGSRSSSTSSQGRGWKQTQVPLPRPLCLACTCCPTLPGRQEARLPAPPCRLSARSCRGEGLAPCRHPVLLLFLFSPAGHMCWLNVSAAAFGSRNVTKAIWLLFLHRHGLAGGPEGTR